MPHLSSPLQPVVFLLVLNVSLLAAAITSVQLAARGSACPAYYEKIGTWAECRAALDFLDYKESGEQYMDNENEAGYPSGCYKCSADVEGCVGGVYFNEHSVGSSVPGTQLVCVHTEDGFATGKTLFIGDSDTDYWATSPSPSGVQAYAFADSYNVAVAGATCEDVLGEIDTLLQVFQPAAVAITCGENDMTGDNDSPDPDTPPSKAFDHFKQIVTKVNAVNARVFITGTKPEPSTRLLWGVYREYDSLVKGLAAELADNASPTGAPPLVQIDSDNGFLDVGNPNTLYDSDQLHLSASGYDLWTRWLRLALADTTRCVVWRSDQCAQSAASPQASPTVSPTTASPTTASPTTASPTTAFPTTASPTTASPATASPTTAFPTTASPTTAAPTASPTTASPSSVSPTTVSPTTVSPTTASPTPFVVARVSANVTFSTLDIVSFDDETFTSEFTAKFKSDVSVSAGVSTSAVTVVSIDAGSVTVASIVEFGTSSTLATAFSTKISTLPATVFTSLTTYGTVAATTTVVDSPTTSPTTASPTKAATSLPTAVSTPYSAAGISAVGNAPFNRLTLCAAAAAIYSLGF